MPDVKISQLPAASSVAGTDELELNQSGTSRKATRAQLVDGLASSDAVVAKAGDTMTGPLIVSTNSSSDALRITQTGVGNALVVEDSANPDATPFVVNTDGTVLLGTTAVRTIAGQAPEFLIERSAAVRAALARNTNDANGPVILSAKSRGTTSGSYTAVASGDALGTWNFAGSDGTADVIAASIRVDVDGTPGTNDMPGRLVFSTTLDGASSPTERMRIDNAGAVGIGTTSPDATRALTLNRTGNYGGIDFRVNNSSMARIQQESTGNLFIDSGIAVTSGSIIFRTANSNERMRIDGSGQVGIGGTPAAGRTLTASKNITGSTTSRGIASTGQIQSDVTAAASYFATSGNTVNSSFTLSILQHYAAIQGTIGVSSTITNQYGFYADATMVGATNNYGFYSDIASASGRWNFYAAGTAANYFAGDMQFDKTVTAGGTTGAQTINKNAGSVNFAAAASSLVVTNSRVTANSIVIATVATNDSTMKSVIAVPGAGSFTLTANAAATAETRVNWIVIN